MARILGIASCTEGITFADAVAAIDPLEHQLRETTFATAKVDESRAAAYLHLFTGLMPSLEDSNGRQRAVDLVLTDKDRSVEIAEVTSTLDERFQRDRKQSRHLVGQINRYYNGSTSWAVGFEYGWALPRNSDLAPLASELACELQRIAAEESGDEPVPISSNIVAYPIDSPGPALVVVSSWSSNVPVSPKAPYLNRLSTYLNASDLIAKKCSKLRAESIRLGTSRRHLYLLMASSGQQGGLLPASPSNFTSGSFACPSPLTDLWLDGGTGHIYHWSDSFGWVFHTL